MKNKRSRARVSGMLLVGLISLLALASWAVFAQGNNAAGGNGGGADGNQPSNQQGYFAKGQALAGSGLYTTYCQICHGQNLQGKNGPALKGTPFAKTWLTGNYSADDLYYVIHSQMPYNHPGTLSHAAAVDLVAYLLQQNGLPSGKTPLPMAESALKKIKLPKQSAKQPANGQ